VRDPSQDVLPAPVSLADYYGYMKYNASEKGLVMNCVGRPDWRPANSTCNLGPDIEMFQDPEV
jgi:hypothetical protein